MQSAQLRLFGSVMIVLIISFTVSAETAPIKASFDCAKATSEIEKTICGSKALADLDLELAAIYKDLISNLFQSEINRLKEEQLQWLAARDASCVKARIKEACLQDLYSARVETLKKKKQFAIPRTKIFKTSKEIYAERGGDLDINLKRDIWFDVYVDFETGILKGKWKNEPAFSADVLGESSEVEILIVKPLFDDPGKRVEGYYFVALLGQRSYPESDGRGRCGAGYENEIAVLLIDLRGRLISEDRHLIDSCLKPIGSVIIRDSTREKAIYVIYDRTEDFKLLKIETLYPRKPVVEIKGKIESKN